MSPTHRPLPRYGRFLGLFLGLLLALGLSACSDSGGDDAGDAAGGDSADQAAEVQALVDEAVALYESEGDAAFATFTDPDGGFVRGDLYIFANDGNDVIVAHGGNPDLVGENADDVLDADGQPIGPIVRAAASPEGGWAEYRYENYADGQIEPKRSFVKRVGDVVIGAGYYESEE